MTAHPSSPTYAPTLAPHSTATTCFLFPTPLSHVLCPCRTMDCVDETHPGCRAVGVHGKSAACLQGWSAASGAEKGVPMAFPAINVVHVALQSPTFKPWQCSQHQSSSCVSPADCIPHAVLAAGMLNVYQLHSNTVQPSVLPLMQTPLEAHPAHSTSWLTPAARAGTPGIPIQRPRT